MDKQYANALWNLVHTHNDEASFKQLFGHFFLRLVRFSMIFVGSKEEAEELVADIFIKLWNYKDKNSRIEDITAYLYMAARNQSYNHIKKFSRYRMSVSAGKDSFRVIETGDPERTMEWREICFRLEQAVESLPLQCKTVFRLIREEGFKYKEVAEILNISPRTVETQLERAVRKLSKMLAEYICIT